MKRRILMLFLLVSLCSCAFFSSYSLGLFLPQRFAAAQAQWEASGIHSYEAVIAVLIPFNIGSQYRIVVNDDIIIAAGWRSLLTLHSADMYDYSPEMFTPIDAAEVADYTIEELMNLASQTVGSAPLFEIRGCNVYWDADYDTQYGYVRSLRFHPGGGFIGCQIGDGEGSYTVLSFTPLAP